MCLFLASLFFLVTNLNALEVKGQSTYTYKSLKKDRPLAELEAKKMPLKITLIILVIFPYLKNSKKIKILFMKI